MKKNLLGLLILCLVSQPSWSQDSTRLFYNPDFKWTIYLPTIFIDMSKKEIKNLKNTGDSLAEKVSNKKVEEEANIICALRSGDNSFEANYIHYDSSIDGDFKKSSKDIYNMFYKVYTTTVPNVYSVDTTISTELIDKLKFSKFHMTVFYTNNIFWHVFSYTRQFGNKRFTASITFVDADKGELLFKAWLESTFQLHQ